MKKVDILEVGKYPKYMENKYVVWALLIIGAFLLISGIKVGAWAFIVPGLILFGYGAKSKFGKK